LASENLSGATLRPLRDFSKVRRGELASLPVAELKAPDGFKVEVFASGVANAREMRVSDKGTVFVGSRLVGKVHAVREKDGKREVKVIAADLHRPSGVALHNGALYVAELSKVWRYDDIENNIDNLAKPVLISDQFPKRRGARLEVHRHRTRRQALTCRSARPATSTCRPRRTRRSAA
jgi:glucose/arabinose dehydrogenase